MDDVTGLQIRLEIALDEIRHLNEVHAKDRAELAQWRSGVRRIVYRVKSICSGTPHRRDYAHPKDAIESIKYLRLYDKSIKLVHTMLRPCEGKLYRVTVRPKGAAK